MKRKSQVLLLLMSLVCGSAFAEEQVAPHVAFWTSLAGRWTYEISSDGTKGKVTWQMQARGSALMGRFQDDQGNVSVELAGARTTRHWWSMESAPQATIGRWHSTK